MSAGLVVLSRSTVARWLVREESAPAGSVADVLLRDELRQALDESLTVTAARRAAGALAGHAMSPVSHADTGGGDAVPFGDELTTKAAAAALRVCPRTVRRWCYLDADHPDRLRFRRRGVLLVSGFDVAARLGR